MKYEDLRRWCEGPGCLCEDMPADEAHRILAEREKGTALWVQTTAEWMHEPASTGATDE